MRRKFIRRSRAALVTLLLIAAPVLPIMQSRATAEDSSSPSGLVISEFQTGGCSAGNTTSTCTEDAKQEFVELYNQGADSLLLTNWELQYVTSSGKTTTSLGELNGQVTGHGHVLFGHASYYDNADLHFGLDSDSGLLAKTAGYLLLVNPGGTVADAVGWGSGSAANLTSWPSVSAPKPGYSVKRTLPGDPSYGSGPMFGAGTYPTNPLGGDFTPTPPDPTAPLTPTGGDTTTCEGVVITELLPNPAGSDTGHEFIELYNPTNAAIALKGCSLMTTASSTKAYSFADNVSLQPDEYQAFYDNTTGLTLPNSAGGTAWLLSPTDELQAIQYPADLGDDVSWSLVSGTWQTSFAATPGAPNVLLSDKPCPVGQERNADTGQCRNIVLASVLTPCKTGQYRSPETNRCRSLAAAAAPTPCKAGQIRNPATNRCKASGAATSGLKPCQTGWVRNPDTNRCRKGAAAAAVAGVKDIISPLKSSATGWIVAGVALTGAAAYGLYEWRQEFVLSLARFRHKFSRSS